MFRLHDKTRRRICIAGFFAIGIVPTVLVSAWCIVRHRPGHVAAESQRLSRRLGLDVKLDAVRYLRPGAMLYEGFELADPETGKTVLRCRMLEATWKKHAGRKEKHPDLLVLTASQPQLETDALGRLGQLIHSILQRRTGRPDVDVRLTAREVTLHCGKDSLTLTDLHGGIDTSSVGAQAQIAFRPVGVDSPDPVRVRLWRNRQTNPPSSGFELDTAAVALPWNLLAAGPVELDPLGPRCRFRGYIWANQTPGSRSPNDWDGELTGQLLDVDLDRLVTDRFPHKLSGTAEVTIQPARFHRGRLEEAAGIVTAGPGVIGRSLIDAAVERLGLVRNAQPSTTGDPGDLVPYEQLSVGCILDSDGLRLQGRCAMPSPGAILVDRRGRLLSEPRLQPQPVVALLQMLVPHSEVQVPATCQTDRLMRRLPVPQIVRPTGVEPIAPRARLRLGAKGS